MTGNKDLSRAATQAELAEPGADPIDLLIVVATVTNAAARDAC
jgi:hypothetical protein